MRYPIAIEMGSDGIVVPDLPGCFSAGDTLDEAIANAEEAIAVWIDAARNGGEPIPTPSSLEAIRDDSRFGGWSFDVVSVGDKVGSNTN